MTKEVNVTERRVESLLQTHYGSRLTGKTEKKRTIIKVNDEFTRDNFFRGDTDPTTSSHMTGIPGMVRCSTTEGNGNA